MSRLPLKSAVFALAVIGAAVFMTAAVHGNEPPPRGPDDGDVVEFVDRRIAEWEVGPEDRRFDETGWATEILEALRLAREHGRPVFLFTHDGRMGIGRC